MIVPVQFLTFERVGKWKMNLIAFVMGLVARARKSECLTGIRITI
jgi:hypothetical protein